MSRIQHDTFKLSVDWLPLFDAGKKNYSVSPQDSIGRVEQWVKWELQKTLEKTSWVFSYMFQDAYTLIKDGKGSISLPIKNKYWKIITLHWNFSIHLDVTGSSPKRTIIFSHFDLYDEFGETKIEDYFLLSEILENKSYLQIFILEQIWEKEDNNRKGI